MPSCFTFGKQGNVRNGHIEFTKYDVTLAQCAERCTQITGCVGIQYRAKAKRCRPMTKRSCDSTNVFSTASAWDLEWNYYNLVPNCYTPRCYLNKISGGLSSGGELSFRKPLTLTQFGYNAAYDFHLCVRIRLDT